MKEYNNYRAVNTNYLIPIFQIRPLTFLTSNAFPMRSINDGFPESDRYARFSSPSRGSLMKANINEGDKLIP